MHRFGSVTNEHFEPLYTSMCGLTRDDYTGKRVLDIGCGPCGSLEWADMATRRIGLDPRTPQYLNLGIGSHRMEYVTAPPEKMPFPDGYFDVVSCLNFLDHTDDLHMTIGEIKRVTKRGGYFLVSIEINRPPTAAQPIMITECTLDALTPEFECFAHFAIGTPPDHNLHRAVAARKPQYIPGLQAFTSPVTADDSCRRG
jgi:ubiquinone/menaquinone biosynthesis C-methylase UbiE